MRSPSYPAAIGHFVLLRVLWRSFFFQAANNYERMQNVGFAYCMLPALRKLYTGEHLNAAVERHLTLFNSHPYLSAALLGASIRLEEDVAAGRLDSSQVVSFKQCMMGPMAAIGDSFFWASLRPFVAACAILGLLSGMVWAPVGFLVFYNALHLAVRIYGLWNGYSSGQEVCSRIHSLALVRFSGAMHYLAAAFIGVIAAILAENAKISPMSIGDGMEPFLIFVLTMIFLLCLKRRLAMPFVLYGTVSGCLALVFALNTFLPLR